MQIINDNRLTSPANYLLKNAGSDKLPVKEIAGQITLRPKAEKKLSGLPVEKMLFLKIPLEQSSGTITARYKASLINGHKLIDLTGGLGIDDFFFAENFDEVIHIERDAVLSEIASFNAKSAGKNNISFVNADSVDYIKNARLKSDWIYVDPARRDETGRSVDIKYLQPDIVLLKDKLFEIADNIMVKLSPAFDLHEAKRYFPEMKEFIVISVNDECRETLLILEKGFCGKLKISAAELRKEEKPVTLSSFENEMNNDQEEKEIIGTPFIFESFASIAKAGLNNVISKNAGLKFIPGSEFYFWLDSLPENFPGKTYKVETTIPYNLKKVKQYLKSAGIKQINIKAKGIPLKPEEITGRLGIKNGGQFFMIIAGQSGNYICYICKQVNPGL